MPAELTEAEIHEALATRKFMVGDLDWKNAPTNTAFFEATANLLDDKGATIPGLTVSLQYRRGTLIDECKFKFTVFLFRGRPHRLYQIEVVPPHQQSHMEDGKKWYGPHQHFGNRAAQIAEAATLGCTDHEEWFKVFLKHANIEFSGKYEPPTPPQLDLDLDQKK